MLDAEAASALAGYKAWADRLTHGFTARNVMLHPVLDTLWPAQQAANEWLLAWSDAQSRDT